MTSIRRHEPGVPVCPGSRVLDLSSDHSWDRPPDVTESDCVQIHWEIDAESLGGFLWTIPFLIS